MSEQVLTNMAGRPRPSARHTVSVGAVTKRRDSRRSSTSTTSTSNRTIRFVAGMTNRHGGKLCEITGNRPKSPGVPFNVVGSHILPYAALKRVEKNQPMWKLLEMFWPAEQVQELRNVLCNNPNALENSLLVEPNVHMFWDQRAFYLEVDWDTVTPLRNRYKVTLHWVDVEAPGIMTVCRWNADDSSQKSPNLTVLEPGAEASLFPCKSVTFGDFRQNHYTASVNAQVSEFCRATCLERWALMSRRRHHC